VDTGPALIPIEAKLSAETPIFAPWTSPAPSMEGASLHDAKVAGVLFPTGPERRGDQPLLTSAPGCERR